MLRKQQEGSASLPQWQDKPITLYKEVYSDFISAQSLVNKNSLCLLSSKYTIRKFVATK